MIHLVVQANSILSRHLRAVNLSSDMNEIAKLFIDLEVQLPTHHLASVHSDGILEHQSALVPMSGRGVGRGAENNCGLRANEANIEPAA